MTPSVPSPFNKRPFPPNKISLLFFLFLFLSFSLLLISFSLFPFSSKPNPSSSNLSNDLIPNKPSCDYQKGRWVYDPQLASPLLYGEDCPFHRNAWNCMRNKRENMGRINSWRWVPYQCALPRVDPLRFLRFMRNRRIGFVGDSLNENFLVAFLCTLRAADEGAKRWKKKGAWRGAYFPKYNVTVAYHRAVLLAKYQWQPANTSGLSYHSGLEGIYRVDVDVPADDWIGATKFYDVLIFNTGHWWGEDKFPKEKPLVFYKNGKPILPPLGMRAGLGEVLRNMVPYIESAVPEKVLKFWRTQSPRHFYGGEWNQNGSCLFDNPLKEGEIDIWFDPKNKGVNREAREVNSIIEQVLVRTSIHLLDLTHMSEFRADAHPAIWLGRKDAVAVWGQDCMHWCLPGVPDTWVDVVAALITDNLGTG